MFESADQDPAYLLRTGTERVIFSLLLAEHGKSALAQRPISPELSIPTSVPADFGQAIAAARRVASEARAFMLDYARKARGDGTPWRELAEPLGVDVDETDDPAAEAFKWVAGEPSMPYDPRYTGWRCSSCRKTVTDMGPYNNNPIDDEKGHAEDCARHAAEIAAFQERINS